MRKPRAIIPTACLLLLAACGQATPTATQTVEMPTPATISRECEDHYTSLYKTDAGKPAVSTSGMGSKGTDAVNCLIDKGKVPASVADKITEAQHEKKGYGTESANGYEYQWSVYDSHGVIVSSLSITQK